MKDKNKKVALVGGGAAAGVTTIAVLWSRKKGSGGSGQVPGDGNGGGNGGGSTATISAPEQVDAGSDITVTGAGFVPEEMVAVVIEGDLGAGAQTQADSAGNFTVSFAVPPSYSGVRAVVAVGLSSGRKADTTTLIIEGITEQNYPWGANVQNLGIGMSVDVEVDNNDFEFSFVEANIPKTEPKTFHHYFVRTFDPQGRHVKDAENALSDTDPQDIHPSIFEIDNVAGQCTICDYQPGTWTFVFLASLEDFQMDESKPLKYGPGTVNLEGKAVQFLDEIKITV